MHDLRIGKHTLDIHFWRDGERTEFDIIKGDPKLVERRDIAAARTQRGTTAELVQAVGTPTRRSSKSGSRRRAAGRTRPQSG
jgi:hypothetical protein